MPVSQREYGTLDKPAQSDKAEGFPGKGWILDILFVQVQRCAAHSPLGKDHSPAARSRVTLEPPAISCRPRSLSAGVTPGPASYFCSVWDAYNGPVLLSHPPGLTHHHWWSLLLSPATSLFPSAGISFQETFALPTPLHCLLPGEVGTGSGAVQERRQQGGLVDGTTHCRGNEENPIPGLGPSCGHFPQGWFGEGAGKEVGRGVSTGSSGGGRR